MIDDGRPAVDARNVTLRIAGAGDLHCRASTADEVKRAFRELQGDVDLVLLAGDLTTHGDPAEALVLAEARTEVDVPVVAVLGNHDWHLGHHDEIARVLAAAGIAVLDREVTVVEVRGQEIGVVGAKGFVGGFAASHLPDFGEPLLRQVYAETTRDVEALEDGLRRIATCPLRIVLLHYAPTASTLEGERPEIWAFLGTDRLAAPIREHEPDLVLHGHAHFGALEGRIGEVPVYNVSTPVMGSAFRIFELTAPRLATSIH